MGLFRHCSACFVCLARSFGVEAGATWAVIGREGLHMAGRLGAIVTLHRGIEGLLIPVIGRNAGQAGA